MPSIYFVMCKPLVFPFHLHLLISPNHHLLCSKRVLRTFVVHWFSLESYPGNLSTILRQVPRRPEADFRVGKLTCKRAWYALQETKLEWLNLNLTNKDSVPTQTDRLHTPSAQGSQMGDWLGLGSTWVSGQVICSGYIANNFAWTNFDPAAFDEKINSL